MNSGKKREKEIEHILGIFGDYIASHDCFDVVFSPKIGYIWLRLQEDDIEGATPMSTAQELLPFLFDEIIYDAMFSSPHGHMESSPTAKEREKAKGHLRDIVSHAGREGESYLRLFQLYLKTL